LSNCIFSSVSDVPEQRFVENQVGQVGHDDHFVGYFLGMF